MIKIANNLQKLMLKVSESIVQRRRREADERYNASVAARTAQLAGLNSRNPPSTPAPPPTPAPNVDPPAPTMPPQATTTPGRFANSAPFRMDQFGGYASLHPDTGQVQFPQSVADPSVYQELATANRRLTPQESAMMFNYRNGDLYKNNKPLGQVNMQTGINATPYTPNQMQEFGYSPTGYTFNPPPAPPVPLDYRGLPDGSFAGNL